MLSPKWLSSSAKNAAAKVPFIPPPSTDNTLYTHDHPPVPSPLCRALNFLASKHAFPAHATDIEHLRARAGRAAWRAEKRKRNPIYAGKGRRFEPCAVG